MGEKPPEKTNVSWTKIYTTLKKRTWGFWWKASWTWTSHIALQQKRWMMSCVVLVLSAHQGRWPFLFTQHWWDHWSSVSSSRLTGTRETGRESTEEAWRWKRNGSISAVSTGWESWDSLPWRRLRESRWQTHISEGRVPTAWSRALFSVAWLQDQRQWAQSGTQNIPFEHQETLFTMQVTEPWKRLPRKVEESPSFAMFKRGLNTLLGKQS